MLFQDIIVNLQTFWQTKGCAVVQPLDIPVGAGTLAPSTALRCMLPKPWSACYVQGCRRPNDGRYGHNPNRLSHYYQFQVIMQPAHADAQGLFLESLEALSIDTKRNDVRFLEDDWENPSIGAAGLGWEIWLNGLEITQCTFFQKMASTACPTPALEYTYGLERIAMFLQNVDCVFDLRWNNTVTYGDLFKEQEQDLSRYCFDHAHIPTLKTLFETHLQEAQRLLAQDIIICAFEQCLFASSVFNILHARGALSTAEREEHIATLRTLSRTVAQHYKRRHGYED